MGTKGFSSGNRSIADNADSEGMVKTAVVDEAYAEKMVKSAVADDAYAKPMVKSAKSTRVLAALPTGNSNEA